MVVGGGGWCVVVGGGGWRWEVKRGIQFSKTVPVFQGGPPKGNPAMTTNTVTARTKGDSQFYVEGEMKV